MNVVLKMPGRFCIIISVVGAAHLFVFTVDLLHRLFSSTTFPSVVCHFLTAVINVQIFSLSTHISDPIVS